MNELFDLYQEIILDHNKRPRNYRKVEKSTHEAEGNNPVCGDEISVSLRVDDGRVTDVGFQGEGCAISKASASLMTSDIKGKSVTEVIERFEQVKGMLTGTEENLDILEKMGNIACLSGVRQFPARIKCATLAWHALSTAIRGGGQATTE
jgi:nitrogen fixation NifU-like protein